MAAAQVDTSLGTTGASAEINASHQEADLLLVPGNHFHQTVVEPCHWAVDHKGKACRQPQTYHQQQKEELVLALVAIARIPRIRCANPASLQPSWMGGSRSDSGGYRSAPFDHELLDRILGSWGDLFDPQRRSITKLLDASPYLPDSLLQRFILTIKSIQHRIAEASDCFALAIGRSKQIVLTIPVQRSNERSVVGCIRKSIDIIGQGADEILVWPSVSVGGWRAAGNHPVITQIGKYNNQ